MRLTSVVLHSSYDVEDLEFSVREGSFKNRYIVRQIVGIDAEDIVPKFYGFGAVSGAPGYERVMKPRDIVMRITLNPKYSINETVSDIRDEIYRLISANRSAQLQLQFYSGGSLVSVINGMITKVEAAYFAHNPELQVTFNCPDPMFRSIHPVNYEPADLPSANPIILPDSASTAPHGFSFKVEFTSATTEFTIADDPTTPDWFFTITPSGGFAIGDELHFSSEYGQKLVYHDKASPVYLMDKVEAGSVWPMIFPGPNTLYFLPIANFDWLELKYYAAYWGV